jgi:hypothetical protein
MLQKIVSGGQAGTDRAALDFAIEAGLQHGGFVPLGRVAEDGRIDERYHLTELPSPCYETRTLANVMGSDGTVIISLAQELTGGSALTLAFANATDRPVIHLYELRPSPHDERSFDEADRLTQFVVSKGIQVLNVAGPRETAEPGVYRFTLKLLRRFWHRHTT